MTSSLARMAKSAMLQRLLLMRCKCWVAVVMVAVWAGAVSAHSVRTSQRQDYAPRRQTRQPSQSPQSSPPPMDDFADDDIPF